MQECPPEPAALTNLRRSLAEAKAEGDFLFAGQVQAKLDRLTEPTPTDSSTKQRQQRANIVNDTVRLEKVEDEVERTPSGTHGPAERGAPVSNRLASLR